MIVHLQFLKTIMYFCLFRYLEEDKDIEEMLKDKGKSFLIINEWYNFFEHLPYFFYFNYKALNTKLADHAFHIFMIFIEKSYTKHPFLFQDFRKTLMVELSKLLKERKLPGQNSTHNLLCYKIFIAIYSNLISHCIPDIHICLFLITWIKVYWRAIHSC